MHFGCILSIYVYRATAHDITHRNQYNVHFRMYLIAAINFSYLQEALQVPINHDYFVVQISAALNLCVLLYLKDTEERRGERDSERERKRESRKLTLGVTYNNYGKLAIISYMKEYK